MSFISEYLSDKYRVDLGRPETITHVDPEGLERWIGDYRVLRYKGLSFDQAMSRINADINAIVGLPADTWPPDWKPTQPEPGPAPTVLPLRRDGLRLVEPDGAPWRCRGVTAFTAGYWLRLNDTARLQAYADWTHSIGANCWRIFCMWGSRQPSYALSAQEVYETVVMCDSLGIRPWLVLFTDQVAGSPVLMPQAARVDYAREVRAMLREHDGIALVEEMNEPFKNGGCSVPASVFDGLNAVRGAPEDGAEQPGSVLTFCTEHTPRTHVPEADWSRRAKNLFETRRQGGPPRAPFLCPVMAGEPEQLERATPRAYADYMAVCDLFADGGVLHGNNTRLQECLAPADGQVANAIADIWRDAIEPEFADQGTYTRGGLADCPLAHRDRYDESGREVDARGALRTFAMLLGSRARAVVVDPGKDWELQAANGWRVTRQRGPHGQIVDLER